MLRYFRQDLIDFTPARVADLDDFFNAMDKVKRIGSEGANITNTKHSAFTLTLIKALSRVLQQLAENLTTRCSEYKGFQDYMEDAFENYFECYIFDVSNKCPVFSEEQFT